MRNLIFTIVFAAVCSISAFAENYYYDEVNGQIIWFCQEDNGEYTLLSPWWCYNHLSDYEDILSQYGYSASNYYYTGNFIIPDYITRIYYEAFAAVVPFQDGGQYIDNEGLTSVTIPSSVTGMGSSAFARCTRLTSVTIPNSVTRIESSTFERCTRLTSVTIPNSVTFIGSSAFSECTSLRTIEIPNSVTSIGDNAFENCGSLTSITIPESVTSIGEKAFYGCSGLTGSLTIPNSVTVIGEEAFSNCSGLRTITIGTGVTDIGRNAFYSCSNLTTVNFNAANCTFMGSSGYPVFENCGTSLVTLNIGEGVTIIPDNAFKKCKSFTSITCAATNPPVIYTSTFDSGLSPMTPVIVPCGTVADYQRYWYIFRNIQEVADCGSTGIDNDYANEIALFPNPATDILNITSSETISEIEIVNALGQVVYRTEVNADNAVCDVNGLTAGVYIVRIHGTGMASVIQKKFIKE
ncbi:MAG: leucine-rich repeat domain-containing protein [Bacteroidales bacterium]|nr:leucine-rich repeat domain-containing protein [Bacteroidales bacterium]